jgi:phosphopantothenoylcysteine synthetase/decarboxylase
MNILVTAGNTQVLIDKVRCITNIFTGRTGSQIAQHCHQRGHNVILLTSHPEVAAELWQHPPGERWTVLAYRTFEQLQDLMAQTIPHSNLDVIIHSAAVSDYLSAGVYAPSPGTHFDPASGWQAGSGSPGMVDMAAGKVKSDAPELWLRLVRAPKLIDRIRSDWGFHGVLVKFKLEVGISEERLLEIAERSRCQSSADLMVANTLEGAGAWARLGPIDEGYAHVSRRELAQRLLDAVEQKHRERSHG